MKRNTCYLVVFAAFLVANSFPAYAGLDAACVKENQKKMTEAVRVLSTQEAMALLDVADADGDDTPDGLFSYGDIEVLARSRMVKPEIRTAANVFRDKKAFTILDTISTHGRFSSGQDGLAGLADLETALAQLKAESGYTYHNLVYVPCQTVDFTIAPF